jgi:Transposase DDE domain group 1
LRHPPRRPRNPAGRPRGAAPPPRPRRGPHPLHEGHRADQLPLHDFDQNQIWVAIVALACELTAWLQTLALTGHHARRWEPKRLRLRLFTIPATLARTGRRVVLHLARTNEWGGLLVAMLARLRALPPGG